jgi:hypothetical protein
MAMTSFDRCAWRCSWLAPLGLVIGAGALVVMLAMRGRNTLGSGWQSAIPVAAVAAFMVGLLADAIVRYHVQKAGTFSRKVDREEVTSALHFGLGYGTWRALMRREHPELRARGGETDNAAGR